METNNIDEEDEDVVIQGSALHEHLSKLGYTDFESMSMPKRTYFEEQHFLKNIDIKNTIKKIYTKLFSFYSWIIQEKSVTEKQLNIILNAEVLLNDHFSMINSLLTKCKTDTKKITTQELIVTGAILISSTYVLMHKHKTLPTLIASSVICCTGYIKHLRFRANRDLVNMISLQNELFAISKKSLKILRRDYGIKLGSETCVQQFFYFLGEKLQYLQLLTETLLMFMEHISWIYYQCSLSIVKLLPPDVFDDELFTKFERASFCISGTINYQALKKLYHTYLLVQSEMLCLLAIAYDSNTWIYSCRKIPETELAHLISILTEKLAMHKVKLSEILNAYDTCKVEPIRYKTRNATKWHDPTVQLDLASHKLQLAYNQVFLIFKDIDDYIAQEKDIDKETSVVLMEKLDKTFKEMNTAKSLAEFIVLLMTKSDQSNNLRNNRVTTNSTTIDQDPDLSVIIDSDPEILDEVFEEYIKEDYSKSLYEEADEYPLEQYKLDKLLAKNFMSELKEVLVDKHKSMSERESKALQRIYKNIVKSSIMETENDMDSQFIPVPPPMPPCYIWLTSSSNIKSDSNGKDTSSFELRTRNNSVSVQEKIDEPNQEYDSTNMLKCNDIFGTSTTETYEREQEETLTSRPQILLETQAMQFITKLPPAFLQEEIFIGSGETSEDEIIRDASDNDSENGNNENLQ